MKKASDIIVLDDQLRVYAGQEQWHGIAWVYDHEDDTGMLARDEEQRNEKRRREFIQSLPARYREYSFENLREHDGNREAISTAKALRKGGNLFIHGPAGNGKTHLAVATAKRFSDIHLVEFWGVAKLFSTLRAAAASKADRPNLYRPAVLVLDDLGKVKATDFVYQEFYAVLEERWADERTTIFTANHRPSECAAQLAPDAHSAAAILSRMASGAVVEVKGNDERLARREGNRA